MSVIGVEMYTKYRFPLLFVAFSSFFSMTQLRADCPELTGSPGDYTSGQVAEFLDSSNNDILLVVNRGFTLPAGAILRRPVEIISPVYSPVVINLNGGSIDPSSSSGDIVKIHSLKNADGSWCQLSDVTLKNGTIDGAVRIWGLGLNGQSGDVPESSHTLGHTERAQAYAPTNITLDNLTIIGHGRIPLYISPGTTYVTVTNCHFTGTRSSTTIYLDAESAHNTFLNNVFDTTPTGTREVFAIDGSAHNLIKNNFFPSTPNGGIFIYRNCGEGGAVRHQEPRFNEIIENEFTYSNYTGYKPAIWLGSRNYFPSSYCDLDSAYPFGSGLDDHDFARQNSIIRNNTTGRSQDQAIWDHDIDNVITENYDDSIFDLQPTDQKVVLGQTAVFTATEYSDIISYQWFKENTGGDIELHDGDDNGDISIVSSANHTSLTIKNVDTADLGNYYCVATNTAGSTASDTVTLSEYSRKMLAHWKLDETVVFNQGDYYGPVLEDTGSLPDGNIWNYASGMVNQPGPAGGTDRAYDFAADSSLGGVETNTSNVIPETDDFSLLLWFKTDNHHTAQGHLFSNNNSQTGRANVYVENGQVVWWVKDGPSITGPTAIDDNQWHRLIITRYNDSWNLYLDDYPVQSDMSPATFDQDTVWMIGRARRDLFDYEGLISDVRVYNYAVDRIPDLNDDGIVNLKDFAMFADHWLESSCYACQGADLNLDEQVNADDLPFFSSDWLTLN